MKHWFIIELSGVGIVHSVQVIEFVRKIVSKLLTLVVFQIIVPKNGPFYSE